MPLNLPTFKREVIQEYSNILSWWEKHSADNENGGFYGRITEGNKVIQDAPKGLVLNTRILWSFSHAYLNFKNPNHLKLAERAFRYIKTYFIDKKYGGVYWMLNADGSPEEPKKQMYGHSFAIYALSEFYRATKTKESLDLAIQLWNLVEKYAFDPKQKGYIEAFSEDWTPTSEYILSRGESRKSMNTHLHLLEAFTNLYRVWKGKDLQKQLKSMIEVFMNHIISENRMRLFFDENWNVQSKEISYGHDIEASWLLWEAAEILHDKTLLPKVRETCINMAKTACDGLAENGGMNYEFNPETKHLNTNKDWWVQAEAMVGFFNAYQLSGKTHFLEKSINSWEFIKKYLIDKQIGEWFWGVKEDFSLVNKDKMNAWKAPYHNSRACIEIWKRI